MAEPFKNLLNAAVIDAAAKHLRRAWPAFDAKRFRALALDGLDALELKARAMQIAAALEATLPPDFDAAAGVIEAALGPPLPADGSMTAGAGDAGLAGWIVWPLGEYVARRGIEQPERALRALHALTQRNTAEWAIRPFIERHPAIVFATLRRWTADASPHVRRLVSEGSRPRLPWGVRLKALIADPSPTLPLLRVLQDDPSEYVRRSVANHLNDIAKDHPALVALWIEQHLSGAPPTRAALLRHAARTLVKRGDARVLHALGHGQALKGKVTLLVAPARIRLGEAVRLHVTLRSTSAQAQRLVIDYAVHHVKARGGAAAKVFKGWTIELAPRATRELSKTHAVRPVTIRVYHPGRHAVDLRVNGQVLAHAAFELVVPHGVSQGPRSAGRPEAPAPRRG